MNECNGSVSAKEVPHASRLRGESHRRPAVGREVPHASRLRGGSPIGVPPLGGVAAASPPSLYCVYNGTYADASTNAVLFLFL